MKMLLISLVALTTFLFDVRMAKAESEAACAIWLCLPGGFPTGCAAAHSEFKHRIKKGRSPLPNLSSCTTGPDGSTSNGRYELGVEYFMPCKEGFKLDPSNSNPFEAATCKPTSTKCSLREKYRRDEQNNCTSYAATRRTQPRYVKMWVDGQYLGQFFYQ